MKHLLALALSLFTVSAFAQTPTPPMRAMPPEAGAQAASQQRLSQMQQRFDVQSGAITRIFNEMSTQIMQDAQNNDQASIQIQQAQGKAADLEKQVAEAKAATAAVTAERDQLKAQLAAKGTPTAMAEPSKPATPTPEAMREAFEARAATMAKAGQPPGAK